MSKSVMEKVSNSHEQMGMVQQRDRKSKKKSNEYPQEKKNPQQNKKQKKHMISKMKTSFSGLTSKLDTEEQVSLSQQRYLQGSRHGSNLSFNSWMNG